jgi:site-specific DNA-methyltransferase (adenine-specific)
LNLFIIGSRAGNVYATIELAPPYFWVDWAGGDLRRLPISRPIAKMPLMNRLLFGDNLKWLRDAKLFPDSSVDLVYLDPPFNSNANYNVLFREASGEGSQAQYHAFTDTWEWTADVDATYADFVDTCANANVVELVEALRKFLKSSPMMAYLAMMAPRLVELRRVLTSTGSLYLHCDPTASHYLKLVLDGVFGPENFRNEISWVRSNPKSLSTVNFPNCRDIILRYSKTPQCYFTKVFGEHDPEYVGKAYRHSDEHGRYRLLPLLNPNDDRPNLTYEFLGVKRVWRWTKDRMQSAYEEGRVVQLKPGAVPQYKLYIHESKGRTITDNWDDIPQVAGKEVLGYPTQKPSALLERIIEVSCPENGVVLDPFCGCGTSVHAAQKLRRRWIGIDVTYLAINLIKRRLRDAFGEDVHFEEHGQPKDFESAKRLAELDKFQFQQWALSVIGARPFREGDGKGADRGVDGLLYFYEGKNERAKLIVQVKGGGNISAKDIRDLVGTVGNQGAMGGVLITLEAPTKPMVRESIEAGRYEAKLYSREYPRIQILTVEGLLSGSERLEAPPQANPFAKAEREGDRAIQSDIFEDQHHAGL